MGTMSQILGNAGSPYWLEHNGRTYEVRLIDQLVKDGFEKRYFERQSRKLNVLRPSIGEEEFVRRKDALEADLDADNLALISPKGLAFIQTVPGVQMLLSLLIGCTEQEVIPLVVAKKDEVVSLVARVIRDSFPGVDVQSPAAPAGEPPPN